MMYHHKKPIQRTPRQNKSLHKLFELWANKLNDAGKDMFTVLKDYVEIPWTAKSVKKHIWLPRFESQDDLGTVYKKVLSDLSSHIEIHTLPSVEEVASVGIEKGLSMFFKIVSDALNDAGQDMRVILKSNTQVWWDKDTVKEYIWRPVQKAQLHKQSTAGLSTTEIDLVYDTCNRHLSKHIESVPFPSVN